MFKDTTTKYETRVDVQRNLLNIVIEMILRFSKFLQQVVLDSTFTTEEKNELNSIIYDLVSRVKDTMQQKSKLELIISDLTINKEDIAYVS